jgi:lipopolysaccharide export system permease protein
MRMGVLTKYLIRVHLGPFLFALSAITGLIFLNAVAQRVDGLVGKGLPWGTVFEFLALSLPHTVALSLPMSVLVAVLYVFSEMTASNEITAISAGGIAPTRILLPLLGMGLVATATMLYFNDAVLPESNHRLKNLLVDIARKRPTLELREQVVNEIRTDQGLDRYFLTAARIDPVENTLEDITIFDNNNPIRQRTTYATHGVMAFNEARTDLYLSLYDGVVHEIQSDRVGGFQRLYFDAQVVPLRGVGNELERRMGGGDRGDREMSFAMLRDNAAEKEADVTAARDENRARALAAVRLALNRPADEDSTVVTSLRAQQARGEITPMGSGRSLLTRDPVTQGVVISTRSHHVRIQALQEGINRLRVELHKKWAIAFACLVFTLIGPPVALRFPRGGVGMVIGASSAIFTVYWIGLIGGEKLADNSAAEPMITMWLANVIFLLVGLLLAARMGRAGGTARGGGWDGMWSRLAAPARRFRASGAG